MQKNSLMQSKDTASPSAKPKKGRDTYRYQRILVVISCSFYCLCSMSMIFANKAVLSVYGFNFPFTFIAFQNGVAALLLFLAKQFGIIKYNDFSMNIAKKWMPVIFIFVGMLISGSASLALVNVHVVTIFKNLTNVVTYMGDKFFFQQYASNATVYSLLLQIAGSVMAGYSDLAFNLKGYLFMLINCGFTAGYVLFLKGAMKNLQLGEFGSVFYNNALSLVVLVPIALITEISQVMQFEYLNDPTFMMMTLFAGTLGTMLSLSSFWLINLTSPTTYGITGALNKIPLALLGMLIFKDPVTSTGIFSVMLGLSGGVVYAWAKFQSSMKKEKAELASKAKLAKNDSDFERKDRAASFTEGQMLEESNGDKVIPIAKSI